MRPVKKVADSITEQQYLICPTHINHYGGGHQALCHRDVVVFQEHDSHFFSENGILFNVVADEADELDYLINSRILTEKEFSGGSDISLTFGDIMTKADAIIKRPVLIKKLVTIGTKLIKYKKVCSMMPENYDKPAIDKWQQAYLDF